MKGESLVGGQDVFSLYIKFYVPVLYSDAVRKKTKLNIHVHDTLFKRIL